jgi:hypothetical protein
MNNSHLIYFRKALGSASITKFDGCGMRSFHYRGLHHGCYEMLHDWILSIDK